MREGHDRNVRSETRRRLGKIRGLRAQADANLWIAAECLRSLFPPRADDASDEDERRAMTGAILLADGLKSIEFIARALASLGGKR